MPNHGSALYEDQSEIDALDWKIVTDGIFGRGVFSGGAVSAQTTPDGSVLVSAGTARVGDVDVPFSAGSVSVISGSANADGSVGVAANATKPRYDLIVVNSTGTLGVVHGDNPTDPVFPDFIVNPVFPTWATTQVVCAAVYVVPALTAIATGHITQKAIRLNKNAFATLLHSISDTVYHSGEITNAQHGIRSVASAHAFSHITGAITAAQGLGLPQALTGAVSATRYVGGTASAAPTTGAFLAGDFVVTLTGKVYVCTVAGSPGTWVLSGSLAAPQNLTLYGAAGAWTDQPAVTTELFGVTSHRHQFDFTGVTQARFKARITTAGLSGSFIRPQYSTDDTTYAVLATTASTDFDLSMTATGTKRSAWANIAAGAKIDPCYIRVVGSDGNGVVDPVIAQIELEVR